KNKREETVLTCFFSPFFLSLCSFCSSSFFFLFREVFFFVVPRRLSSKETSETVGSSSFNGRQGFFPFLFSSFFLIMLEILPLMSSKSLLAIEALLPLLTNTFQEATQVMQVSFFGRSLFAFGVYLSNLSSILSSLVSTIFSPSSFCNRVLQ
ncbi:hypothetical protein CSUI_009731, partial [Cystoisospora suis]